MTPPRHAPALAAVLAAAAAAWQHLLSGRSIDTAIGLALRVPAGAALGVPATALRAAVVDVVFTAARERALLAALMARFAERPPTAPVGALLTVALSQLRAGRHGDFTVVDQAVAAARADPATARAAGFVNALLRRYGREGDAAVAAACRDPLVRANVPAWWLARLQVEWPDDWEAILDVQTGTLGPPPQVLRVNRRRGDVAGMLAALAAQGVAAQQVGRDAIWIEHPLPVDMLPGFAQGLVSVQDAGSQLAVDLLDLHDGQRVLDACAAPGGKTLHLVERADVVVDALERDAERARRIADNVARVAQDDAALAARVRVHVVDATDTAAVRAAVGGVAHGGAPGDDTLYDRIIVDAPCTASGIVRRHPDIPWLRRPADVANLATTQRRLLDALWPLLAPTGRLLYVVCSLFAEEGVGQVAEFLRRHPDARSLPLPGFAVDALRLLPRSLPRSSPPSPARPQHLPRAGISPLVDVPPALADPSSAPLHVAAAARSSIPSDGAARVDPGPWPRVHDGFFYALLTRAPPPR